MIDPERLRRVYATARADLLRERAPQGHWVGHLASSVVSTATAATALELVARGWEHWSAADAPPYPASRLRQLAARGAQWIAQRQNGDGGFGDTDRSYSNIATTMLARAALHVVGPLEEHRAVDERALAYVTREGGVAGIHRRYGDDRTFAVPILTHSALAGLVPWGEVEALPFELACVPQSLFRFLELPVVSYAIPALVAIGQAKFHHDPPWNPLLYLLRRWGRQSSLDVLRAMQPASGGYLEAAPLTSFVAMSLASIGQAEHPVARDGVRFLVENVRADGSWPIDTNLATWNTTLAIGALGVEPDFDPSACLEWLLSCQHNQVHPFTGAEPGGWGWTDLSGAVPDADDTPGALLALRTIVGSPGGQARRQRIAAAALAGARWLLNLQNDDGGWPTFCRGWTRQVFDRSGSDLTAHALRALAAWRDDLPPPLGAAIESATGRGLEYLRLAQRTEGSWLPLWFGNQDHPQEENPLYGTAKVLAAYRDLGLLDLAPARRGLAWLAAAQNRDGGWGGGPAIVRARGGPAGLGDRSADAPARSSVEETALAVEALLDAADHPEAGLAARRGLDWLARAVETGSHQECSPIGFYFAKLWYYETLYPLTFTVSALGRAARRFAPGNARKPS